MVRRYLEKLPRNIEELAHWYMRYISPLSLIAALLLDYFVFLRRVDLWTGNLLLFFYILVAAACITVMNLIEAGRLSRPWILKVTPLIPVVAQFAFGGLFAGYFSLYSRSAALQISWIFIAILIALLIGNERFVRLYRRFVFQFSMFFLVLFSFFIFFLPVIFGKIGPQMFLASGAVSLAIIAAFYYGLFLLIPERTKLERSGIARSVATIYTLFNILYFTGAIPPLPLALKDAGVYHGVARVGDEYRLLAEPIPWYEVFLRYNTLYHRAPSEPVYAYTAIFAPTDLSTEVAHEWQRYDEDSSEWITEEIIPYFIVGGRDGGFRGYSIKGEAEEGNWRVNVVTEYGQIIGRVGFEVVGVPQPVPIELVVR